MKSGERGIGRENWCDRKITASAGQKGHGRAKLASACTETKRFFGSYYVRVWTRAWSVPI